MTEEQVREIIRDEMAIQKKLKAFKKAHAEELSGMTFTAHYHRVHGHNVEERFDEKQQIEKFKAELAEYEARLRKKG